MNHHRACPPGQLYTIKPGDTFYTIAKRYGILLQDLLAANPGVNPDYLLPGQQICIPMLTIISTPCSILLQPNYANLPPTGQIPVGSLISKKMAMSTYSYTFVATGLPNPQVYGNYDSYVGLVFLFSEDQPPKPTTYRVRLFPTPEEQVTWAGTRISVSPPVVQGHVEVRPYNSTQEVVGMDILLKNEFLACKN